MRLFLDRVSSRRWWAKAGKAAAPNRRKRFNCRPATSWVGRTKSWSCFSFSSDDRVRLWSKPAMLASWKWRARCVTRSHRIKLTLWLFYLFTCPFNTPTLQCLTGETGCSGYFTSARMSVQDGGFEAPRQGAGEAGTGRFILMASAAALWRLFHLSAQNQTSSDIWWRSVVSKTLCCSAFLILIRFVLTSWHSYL